MIEEEDEELKRIKELKMEKIRERIFGKTNKANVSKISGKPVVLSDSTFNKFVRDNSIVVVDVWAPWCGPCRFVAPVIEDLAKDYAGKIAFGKVNVDQNRRVATQYSVASIPTLLVFKNGQLVDRIIGAMPRQTLEPKITRHL